MAGSLRLESEGDARSVVTRPGTKWENRHRDLVGPWCGKGSAAERRKVFCGEGNFQDTALSLFSSLHMGRSPHHLREVEEPSTCGEMRCVQGCYDPVLKT